MKSYLQILILGIMVCHTLFAQQTVKMYEKELIIPTYTVDEPDKTPHFYTGRAYQGAQGRVYPYAFDGNLTDNKEDVTYKGLFLENEYLEICVLPELGGRLYYMKDKTNGYDVIYRNNVIKPAMIGMLGAWISGGVEWNVPHHHRASTFMPTDYKLVDNEDGSKTIWVGELDIRHEIRWMVGMTLAPENSNVKIDIRYINQTSQAHPFLIWANTAVHTNENYQVIYPPKTEFATFHRKVDFTRWPISNEYYRGYQFDNADISFWKNTPAGGSFFAWEDQGEFVAGIDHGKDAGICVVGNKNIMIGKKLWTWGTSKRADMWEKILTDKDGPYIEIMTGAYSNNQPDYSWCHPYFSKEATMYFMPLRGMEHVKESTLDAALNFDVLPSGQALVEIHAYKSFKDASIRLQKGSHTIWETKATLSPNMPHKWTVDIPEGTTYYDLKAEVVSADDKALVSFKPEPKQDNPLPETVKPALKPQDINRVEEVVFTGLRMEQIYNPTVSPLSYYEEAIKREPHHAFANLRIGSWYLKEGIFEKAETHLQRAANKWTTDYTRSKDCESFYLLGLAQLALDKEKEAYENFYRASWDYAWYGASHLQLAMLEAKAHHYQQALEHIENSLSVGNQNIRAHEIRASLLRVLGMKDAAQAQINYLSDQDPLNLYVYAEEFFGDETTLETFTSKMRNEVQNYLDVAIKFGQLGLYKDGIKILELAESHSEPLLSRNALVHYYQGYFELLGGESKSSLQKFQEASKLPIDYCFPFRYETEKVLASALTSNPTDANAWYYWGNLLYDHQPQKAIEKWEKAIELNENFAMAHRNIAFAYDHIHKDPQKASKHIALAIKYAPNEPNFYFEQDNYAVKLGEAPESRLAKLDDAGKLINEKDNPLARKVLLKMLTSAENEALEILQTHHFRKVEGVGNIHNAWVDAWLLKGKKQLEQGDFANALKSFEKSLEYPRNLDIGQNDREGQSHYFIGLAYEKQGKIKKANLHYRKATEETFGTEEQYYKAISLEKLGESKQATKTFEDLIDAGNKRIEKLGQTDFFSIFGNRNAENVQLGEAYALIGLGQWGLKKRKEAEASFTKALENDPANLISRTRLFELVKR